MKVEFFATVRDVMGTGGMTVDAHSIRDLLAKLSGHGKGAAGLLCVSNLHSGAIVLLMNGLTVSPSGDLDAPFSDGDEVSVFPPVSGG